MRGLHRCCAKACCAAVVVALGAAVPPAARGQDPAAAKYQFKIGLLPFIDNTVSGGADVGEAVSRAVQAELTHSTELIGRILKLDGVSADDIDGQKAAEVPSRTRRSGRPSTTLSPSSSRDLLPTRGR